MPGERQRRAYLLGVGGYPEGFFQRNVYPGVHGGDVVSARSAVLREGDYFIYKLVIQREGLLYVFFTDIFIILLIFLSVNLENSGKVCYNKRVCIYI